MIDGYKDSDYVGIIREICPSLKMQRMVNRCTRSACPSAQHYYRGFQAERLPDMGEAMAFSEKAPVTEVLPQSGFTE
jgi:hypothetical protein